MATPKLTFYEILKRVEDAKTKKAKIAVLHQFSDVQLKQVLDYTFNPKIKWLIPEGVPPFKKVEDDPDSLVWALRQGHNFRKLLIFLNIGSYKTLTQMKREQAFVDLLGSIHPTDAELLCAMKEKRTPFKSVTPQLVAEAFPKFTTNWA
jgi:hypothetical protein